MARPTDYSAEIDNKAEEYLENCHDTVNTETGVVTKVSLPSVAGLARYLRVARSTVYLWADQHHTFSDILQDILAEQEKRLLENGLCSTYNSNIVKLALGKHGYKDENRVTEEVGETLADLMREGNEKPTRRKTKTAV